MVKSAVDDLLDSVLTSKGHHCEQEKECQKDQKHDSPTCLGHGATQHAGVFTGRTSLNVVKSSHRRQREGGVRNIRWMKECGSDGLSRDCKGLLVDEAA